jgi:hypothetical protein
MSAWSTIVDKWAALSEARRTGVLAFLAGIAVSAFGVFIANAASQSVKVELPLRAFLLPDCPVSGLGGQEAFSAGGVLFGVAAAVLPKVASAAAEKLKSASAKFTTVASARVNGTLYQKDQQGNTIIYPGCLAIVLGEIPASGKDVVSGPANLSKEQLEALKNQGLLVDPTPALYIDFAFRFDRDADPTYFRLDPTFIFRGAENAKASYSALVTLETPSEENGKAGQTPFAASEFPLAAVKPMQVLGSNQLPSIGSPWFKLPRATVDTFKNQTVSAAENGAGGAKTLLSKDVFYENYRPFDASVILTETTSANSYLLAASEILSTVTDTLAGAVKNGVDP